MMLVVDHPGVLDLPVDIGTFVIISLDPIASVAALGDDQATKEAGAMQPGKYLALVDGPSASVYSRELGGFRLALRFLLAGRGLPPPPCSKAMIPIFPAPPHPDIDRSPVHASCPLPWPDCYIHTLHHIGARVSRIYQHHISGPRFTEDQQEDIGELWSSDTKDFPPPAPVRPEPVADPERDGSIVHGELDGQESLGPDDPLLTVPIDDGRPEMVYHVQMWVDIGAFPDIDPPENLTFEMRRLIEIEWNWAQRTVAAIMSKEPQTTAWLEGVVNADAPDVDDLNPIPAEDDSILPEDAIEHRAARDELVDHLERKIGALPAQTTPSACWRDDIASISSHDAQSEAVSRSSAASTVSTIGSDALARPHSRGIGLSPLRWIFSTIGSLALRIRSFIWNLLWRPFSR